MPRPHSIEVLTARAHKLQLRVLELEGALNVIMCMSGLPDPVEGCRKVYALASRYLKDKEENNGSNDQASQDRVP